MNRCRRADSSVQGHFVTFVAENHLGNKEIVDGVIELSTSRADCHSRRLRGHVGGGSNEREGGVKAPQYSKKKL